MPSPADQPAQHAARSSAIKGAPGTLLAVFQQLREALGYIDRRVRDGETVVYLTCPKCGTVGEIDDEQLHGRVSVICGGDGCTFHETRNWYRSALTSPYDWSVPK